MIIYNLFYKHTMCFLGSGGLAFNMQSFKKNKLVIILTFCTFS